MVGVDEFDRWDHGVVGDGKNFCVVSNCCADGVLAPWHGRRCNIANCCETRESWQFCGCGAWLDGLAHGVVVDGRNFGIVTECCDGVEFGRFMVLSRAGRRFVLCCGSICCHSVRPYHPTLQRQQLVVSVATVRLLAPLTVSWG